MLLMQLSAKTDDRILAVTSSLSRTKKSHSSLRILRMYRAMSEIQSSLVLVMQRIARA